MEVERAIVIEIQKRQDMWLSVYCIRDMRDAPGAQELLGLFGNRALRMTANARAWAIVDRNRHETPHSLNMPMW